MNCPQLTALSTPRAEARGLRGICAISAALVLIASAAHAQQPPPASQQAQASPALSLDDAIRLAEAKNEQVAIAQAGVERAEGDQMRARSQLFPQVSASASYDRTLASEFSTEFAAPALPPGCGPYSANASAPLGDRVSAIEQAINCGTIASSLFSGLNSLPFGRENIYRLNLSFSQNLYSGGRIGAQRALAATGRQLAGISLGSAHAQLVFDVTQAFYDAALSDRLVAIAEAGLQQADATAAQVELGWKAGRQPEFEMLRARVARDNQRPVVIRARSGRQLAYLRLAQLLNLTSAADLRVAANLDDPILPVPGRFGASFAEAQGRRDALDVEDRAAVRQAASGVNGSLASLSVARAERLPSVAFSSSYGRVAYPSSVPTAFNDWLTNWTVGASVQVPVLTGGRLRGDIVAAEADVSESRARLDQARKFARLDTQTAYEDLDAATATWQASAGTVEQASRAYEIAELRYREGVSTQLELSDARLLMQQAQANRAQAARDLQVARARIALLPDLPLSAGPLPSLAASPSTTAPASAVPAATAGAAAGSQAIPGQQGAVTRPGGTGGM